MECTKAMEIEEIFKIGAGIFNEMVGAKERERNDERNRLQQEFENSISNMPNIPATEVKITKATNGYIVNGGYSSGYWICVTIEEAVDKVAELFTPVVQ